MSSFSNIALITGIGATATAYGSFTLKDSLSSYNRGNWDWQYKGKLFEDRVGNFSFSSDNKSRYNDYLKNYSTPKVGYSFDLTAIDPHVTSNNRIQQDLAAYKGEISSNPNLKLFGNVTGANTSDSNNYILENKVEGRSQFVTSYNNDKGRPNWVAFKITKNNMGGADRQNNFRDDPNLPANFKTINSQGFPGFDRGHNANSAAFTSSIGVNSSTYVMTNMLAEAHNLNAGPWADLEHYINSKVSESNDKAAYVITGGAGTGGTGRQGYVEKIGGVEVPKVIWKLAVMMEPGQTEITKDTKTIAVIMPNSQNINLDWRKYITSGRDIKKITGIKRFFPTMSEEEENRILDNSFERPKDGKLLNIDTELASNFESSAIINARSKGMHNPLLAPLFDDSKQFQGIVISNKRTHSEQYEMARYNASMRASGRFTSVIDPEDMGTYENILRASKNGPLSNEELAVAKAFDYSLNTPSLSSRMNEFFFIPAGMGRVMVEEKGPMPSLFGAIGALIDQSYITNNPVMRSYKEDGENYFTAKTTFFQDLFSNSAATLISTATSIGVYLAVGEPLKVMGSKLLLNSQEALINAADESRVAKFALGGTDNNNIGFKASVIERQVKGNKSAYYSLENPTFSVYYLENYQRQRGVSFFAATGKEFLISKINPYKHNSRQSKELISAVNDYMEVLQSPADIKIYDRAGEVITSGEKSIDWHTAEIKTAGGKSYNIPEALGILRNRDESLPLVTKEHAKEINDAINKEYKLKITNVSIERDMMLAKKIQKVLNIIPMPWAWGMFAGRKEHVSGPMIGNLVDIEGFSRFVKASLDNQGFWGSANEYMTFTNKGTNANYGAFRLMNHIMTMGRSLLSFNEQGAQSKRDLEDVAKIGKTYSQAEINLEHNVIKRSSEGATIETARQRSGRGYDVFNTDALDSDSVKDLLNNEAKYQAEWKTLSGERVGLKTITLEESVYKYVNKTHGAQGLGFLLNQLDKENSFIGMKIASGKLAAAKWIVGALFIPQLIMTEFGQNTGASLLGSTLAQYELTKGTTKTAIELSSTNFFSAAEVAKMFGASNDVANFVLGTQTLVSMAGLASWTWNHASTNTPEIQAKMFSGKALFDSIEEVDGHAVKGLADIEARAIGKQNLVAKISGGGEIAFNIVRGEHGNIQGLKSLNAKVAKNLTSFTISLGLTLAAMQTARFVISSTINTERSAMGSAVLSTAFLAVPAVALAAAATIDNMAHTANWVGGSMGFKVGYSNYKVTSMLGKGMLFAGQRVANIFGKHPLIASAVAAVAVTGAYWARLSPFQGDLNGPKINDVGTTAILKLSSYVRQVNEKIDAARNSGGGDTSISESVSPLEVNGALLAIALGKIINPMNSSQKGSTAYITAVQSSLPIFQYYSVIKRIQDGSGNNYTTVNIGLQGPPSLGVDPVNITFPIAFAMNAKTSDNVSIRTGYLGTGLMLNEQNKDGLSLQDYYGMYSQLALWSGIGVGVSNGLARNRLWGRNHQILKSRGVVVASESLLTQSLKAGRDKFLGIATLPFYIAAQALNLTTGDLRMTSMRLRSTAFVPLIFGAFMGGAVGNHLYSVFNTLSQPFANDPNTNLNGNMVARGGFIAGGALLFAGVSYYNGTLSAARRLSRLESDLNVPSAARFNKEVDFISKSLYTNKALKGLYRNTLEKFGGFVKKSQVFRDSKIGKGFGLLAVGALWNHFITDPTAGKINPELAYGDLTKQTEDNYSNSIRRYTTVAFGAGLFALTAGLSTFNAKSLIFADINAEHVVEKFKGRLTAIDQIQNIQKDGKKLSFLQSTNLKYQTFKLNQEAREVQIILEEGMGNTPMIIQWAKKGEDKIKNAFKLDDPYSTVKEITSNKTGHVYEGLQGLDISAGNDLNGIIKNNEATSILTQIEKFGVDKKESSAVLRSLSINRSMSNRIHIERYAKMATVIGVIGLAFNAVNWGAQALGYKDFQDALVGADEDSHSPWAEIRKGIVDFVKLQTKYDRAHVYDISKGLVGPNIHNSKGEFLLNPDTTVKGSVNKSLKELGNLIIAGPNNTFVGVSTGGVTLKANDSDVRLRSYFQLQSASQDFSSSMYSMSSVFGLQQLASKGFLAQTLIANLRGIDDAAGHNQAQMRQFASSIITAVYSQPTRAGKDRIKFTAPDKFTLEAMTTNKALAMSLNQRYKRLQSLSYGTDLHIANYMLLNNMNISSPDMQAKVYKALMGFAKGNDANALGDLNQNNFMNQGITVKQIGGLAPNSNPFTPTKLSMEDTNNENAFMDMGGIAFQATSNQYDPNVNAFDSIKNFISTAVSNSALQGVYQGIPSFMWIPIALVGLSALALVGATAIIVGLNKASQGQVTKDNSALWEQQHKYYDEGQWFSKHIYESEVIIAEKTKFLLLKRTQTVFNIAEGLDDLQIQRYTSQINNLSGALSFNFDGAYRDYAKNYGTEGTNYNKSKQLNVVAKLDEFYDRLEREHAPSQTTRLSTRDQRIARNYSREFAPVMSSETADAMVSYTNTNHKITEHILNDFTNKQVLDAYLEGQFDAYKETNIALTKTEFVNKYYRGFTYEDMLNHKSEKFLSKAAGEFGGGFNIFGKNRNVKMTYSIEHMAEVYAAKYDLVIDNFYDVVDKKVKAAFIEGPDNIYSKFAARDLNSVEIIDQAFVEDRITNQRFNNKLKLRADIQERLGSIIMTKRTGITGIFDRLLNVVSGGTNRDLITRMSLEVSQAAISTVDDIRKNAGGVFGDFVTGDIKADVAKAIEKDIEESTRGAIQGSMPAGSMPKELRSTSALGVLEGLSRLGTALMNGYQMAQFVSTNLLTFRASASIASSKTGEREKEMAREELAKEGFENIWSALFFGTLLANEQVGKLAVPGIAGAAAGYFGYDMLFRGRGTGGQIGGAAVGVGLMAASVYLFKMSKTWGVSVGLAGLTLLGRSVVDLGGSSVSALSPEIGRYVTQTATNFYEGGRNVMRAVQNQSGIINTVGGAGLAIGGAMNFLKTRNPINAALMGIGAFISIVGLGHTLDNSNSRLEGASLEGLSGLAQIIVTPYLTQKASQTIVAKTVVSWTTENILKNQLIEGIGLSIREAAIKKTVQGVALRGAIGATRILGWGLKAISGVEAGPWGLVTSIALVAGEMIWTLLHPESADYVTSNMAQWGSSFPGGSYLIKPANQIYSDSKYKDMDSKNPWFQGTVTDAMKQEWLSQIQTISDPTGRSTAGRLITSYDAPMGGIAATSEGYGPGSPDPAQDLAFAIRGKAYNQLVTGKQYWNSRMGDTFNHEMIAKYITTTERLQVQAWEAQINTVVNSENRKITAAPTIGSGEITAIGREALVKISEASSKMGQLASQVNEINTKKNLAINVTGNKIVANPHIQMINDGTPNIQAATQVIKSKNQQGQATLEFNKTTSPNSDQIAFQLFEIKRGKKVEDGLINPTS